MEDQQEALIELTPDQEAAARLQVRLRVKTAIGQETDRIVASLGTQLVERDYAHSSYADSAIRMLRDLVPGFDEDSWRALDGTLVRTRECDTSPCCGYCEECETCHGDGRDDVCNMGHCHGCDHSCDR
jgi:hypothetical protein